MSLTPTELAYLASQHLGRLATLRPDGTLQNSPVGFQWNEETSTIDIFGFNMESSRKFRNVAATGQVAFVVDDLPSVEPWRVRCLEIRGTAEAIEEPTPLIRVHPRRVISFGIEETDTEAHSLTLNARDVA
ncbi:MULTISPECIES: PPOX class F420-dependent oxidoreductase [Actinoplanes]|uniref:PPOX class F420-dependent oxidoreductase n=1 Tax=Actinoplanes TaxID=1865 RepID=UPI0005F2D1F3|nr:MULTISPECIES: PPOX class F420-dependent oxidoreductase [Actinoplanes]GLY02123.1 PPOX class F420-dependent oxidoreductase [Actinoplanes sp. NBRC 101535]